MLLSLFYFSFFFFNDTATTEIYTLSLHDALPISIDETVAIVAIEVDFEVVGPALFTSFRIERDDAVERGGEVESAINEKGSGLETAALSSAAGLGNVAGVKGPGDSKCGHVVATDLGERGVAHSTGVVAIVGPGI